MGSPFLDVDDVVGFTIGKGIFVSSAAVFAAILKKGTREIAREMFEYSVKHGDDIIHITAEKIITGKTVHLKDLIVRTEGWKRVDMGPKEALKQARILGQKFKDEGFEKLKITGERVYDPTRKIKLIEDRSFEININLK